MSQKEYNKHAYLLLTHNYSKVLEILVRMIDDERNDIYIHIDKKTKISYAHLIAQHVSKSKVFFVKRIRTYWGHISMVKAEYSLFQTAFENGPYLYYHLLSGNDLPIKSQNIIHSFFDNHQGEEFVSLRVCDDYSLKRIHTRLLFPVRGLCSNEVWIGQKINGALNLITSVYSSLLRKAGYLNEGFSVYYTGSQWASLTNRAVVILLENKRKVLRCFKFTFCPDEFYKQTVLYYAMKTTSNSSDPIVLYQVKDENGSICLSSARLIDMSRNKPYCFSINDYDRIKQSGAMFCRKIFDEALAVKLYEEFGGQANRELIREG